ncbi:hypothetical protein, partial [uncultured Kocuria sp.]|uniref:hypothetical protein n=1 Tax=uncultured Kocuria sp. TaxID=259305 RepID=UPI0026039450
LHRPETPTAPMTSITEETDNALSHQGQTAPHPVSITDRKLYSGTPGPRLYPPAGKPDQDVT